MLSELRMQVHGRPRLAPSGTPHMGSTVGRGLVTPEQFAETKDQAKPAPAHRIFMIIGTKGISHVDKDIAYSQVKGRVGEASGDRLLLGLGMGGRGSR